MIKYTLNFWEIFKEPYVLKSALESLVNIIVVLKIIFLKVYTHFLNFSHTFVIQNLFWPYIKKGKKRIKEKIQQIRTIMVKASIENR